jgi:CBS domain-containing protein
MARTDIDLDAMLRHLGAAYYDSLHGRATRSDVSRALEAVEEQFKTRQRQAPGGATAPVGVRRIGRDRGQAPAVRHIPRVRDVMTRKVVTVDRLTPFSDIVRLLTEHRISGVPVAMMGRRVAGVVSETDLLALEDEQVRNARMDAHVTGRWGRPLRKSHWGLTAGALMTAPAMTINPDATIPRAARVMTDHHIRRLPVVNEEGKLIGIVTRRDLLRVFLRPDKIVAERVRGLLDDVLPVDPANVTATVRDGVVTLTGNLGEPEDRELIPTAVRLIWDVDGVIDVVNRLGQLADEGPASTPGGPGDGAEGLPQPARSPGRRQPR